jgi:hypothetical protein
MKPDHRGGGAVSGGTGEQDSACAQAFVNGIKARR